MTCYLTIVKLFFFEILMNMFNWQQQASIYPKL